MAEFLAFATLGPTWLADAQASHVQEIRQFARNVRKDETAVRAALVYEHSNGQVEGQVHRLKFIKRAMYDSVGELLRCGE